MVFIWNQKVDLEWFFNKSEFGKVEWVWFTKQDRAVSFRSLEDTSTIYTTV